MRKIFAFLIASALALSLFAGCAREETPETSLPTTQPPETAAPTTAPTVPTEPQGDIAILYTGDIHAHIGGPLSYAVLTALKQELQQQYPHVLLLDAGDHAQGTAYGALDQGGIMVQLMKMAGYDAATLGDEDFSYGLKQVQALMASVEFPYVSANLRGPDGKPMLQSYVTFRLGREVIAVVGITTPAAQQLNGEYTVSAGSDNQKLYADVQAAVDEARAAGATRVIALGHLGTEGPWTSQDLIANVSGLDIFIDGHSHTPEQGRTVTDKVGNSVFLTRTGAFFERIGLLVIHGDTGEISADFVTASELQVPMLDSQGNPLLDEQGNPVTRLAYEMRSSLYSGLSWCSDGVVDMLEKSWIAVVDKKVASMEQGENTQ